MLTMSYLNALRVAARQWHIAMLFVRANLTEARRVNRIATLTPFISVLVQAAALGFVYGRLLGISFGDYLPFLSIGLALWQALSSFIVVSGGYNDTINRHLTFTSLSPYTVHLAGLAETMVLLVAKLLAAFVVIAVVGKPLVLLRGLPIALAGVALVAVFLFFLGIVTAYVVDGLRIVRALLPQVLFLALLVTPVLWQKEQLVSSQWIVDFNPLSHVIGAIRTPLLTGQTPWLSFVVVAGMAAVLAVIGLWTHRANRSLIVFRWVG